MAEEIKLHGEQLAYAKAISLIELKFHSSSHEEDEAYETAKDVVHSLEREAGLYGMSMWRQRVPIGDLYNFTQTEEDLLRDLRDAGGTMSSRRYDSRFRSLGCGNGGKKAVGESAQGDRWYVRLTERGRAYLESLDGQS